MKAYRCDLCGRYCQDVFSTMSGCLDISKEDAKEMTGEAEPIQVRELCMRCASQLGEFIKDLYKAGHPESAKDSKKRRSK